MATTKALGMRPCNNPGMVGKMLLTLVLIVSVFLLTMLVLKHMPMSGSRVEGFNRATSASAAAAQKSGTQSTTTVNTTAANKTWDVTMFVRISTQMEPGKDYNLYDYMKKIGEALDAMASKKTVDAVQNMIQDNMDGNFEMGMLFNPPGSKTETVACRESSANDKSCTGNTTSTSTMCKAFDGTNNACWNYADQAIAPYNRKNIEIKEPRKKTVWVNVKAPAIVPAKSPRFVTYDKLVMTVIDPPIGSSLNQNMPPTPAQLGSWSKRRYASFFEFQRASRESFVAENSVPVTIHVTWKVIGEDAKPYVSLKSMAPSSASPSIKFYFEVKVQNKSVVRSSTGDAFSPNVEALQMLKADVPSQPDDNMMHVTGNLLKKERPGVFNVKIQ